MEYVFTLGRELLDGSFGEFVAAETNAGHMNKNLGPGRKGEPVFTNLNAL